MPNEIVVEIQTRFNEKRTVAAAAVLMKLAGGSMEYMRLLKLLYMSDRLSWDRYGSPITGDDYVAMSQGPVLSGTYRWIKEEVSATIWNRVIVPDGDYTVRLGEEADEDELSEADRALLEEVHTRYKKIKNVFTLVAHLHEELAEWDDPGSTSRPIPPQRILEALGKPPSEIVRIAGAMKEHQYLDSQYGPS